MVLAKMELVGHVYCVVNFKGIKTLLIFLVSKITGALCCNQNIDVTCIVPIPDILHYKIIIIIINHNLFSTRLPQD